MRIWDYAPTSHILTLSVTWRFGPVQCRFLRETSKEYGRKERPLKCALEHEDRKRYDNLAAVPRTAMRFLRYSDTRWFATITRGVLAADAEAIGADARRGRSDCGRREDQVPRAGACQPVFEQMLFEGLLFLRAIAKGRVLLPGGDRPATLAAMRGTRWSRIAKMKVFLSIRAAATYDSQGCHGVWEGECGTGQSPPPHLEFQGMSVPLSNWG